MLTLPRASHRSPFLKYVPRSASMVSVESRYFTWPMNWTTLPPYAAMLSLAMVICVPRQLSRTLPPAK